MSIVWQGHGQWSSGQPGLSQQQFGQRNNRPSQRARRRARALANQQAPAPSAPLPAPTTATQSAPAPPPTPAVQPTPSLPNIEKPFLQAPDFSAPAVAVHVGNPPKIFHVNEKILCAASNYITTALKPVWSEGKDRVVTLSQDSPHIFNIYVNWLYGNRLFVGQSEGDLTVWGVHGRLIDCYVLGDRLLDGQFKDAVTDAMAAILLKLNSNGKVLLPAMGHVNRLYDNTSSGSALRRLFVGRFSHIANLEVVLSDDYHASFLLDVALGRNKSSNDSLQTLPARCEYHEHAPGKENCYRTKNTWP